MIPTRILLFAATTTFTGCCLFGSPCGDKPSFAEIPVIIDVHAHTFNADDLPVRGFVRQVALKDYEADSPTKNAIAKLVAWVVQKRSPGFESEAIRIKARMGGEWTEADQAEFDALSSTQKLRPEDTDQLGVSSEDLAAEFLEQEKELRGVLMDHLSSGELAGEKALGIGSIWSLLTKKVPTLFHWVESITNSRKKIIDELIRLYPEADLHLPALIDYSAWLDDSPKVSLEHQIALCSWFTREYRGLVHFFAPFDPLAAHQAQTSAGNPYLDLVFNAVRERGLIGLKVYPPMGFSPDGRRYEKPALSKETWDGIRTQLERLYAFSADEGVPILTHAAPSLGAGEGFELRANPSNWDRALQDSDLVSKVRVNLGHFGGHRVEWKEAAGKLMLRVPGVYSDLSFFDEVKTEQGRINVGSELNALIREYDVLRERLMYGTDWIMLGHSTKHDCYLYNHVRLFTERRVKSMSAGDYFGKNAARFLGLRKRGEARGRFETFFARHGIPLEEIRWIKAVDDSFAD